MEKLSRQQKKFLRNFKGYDYYRCDRLLKKGADPNFHFDDKGLTLLIYAIQKRDGGRLDYLLKNNIDVNLPDNSEQSSPLIHACKVDSPEFAEKLIHAGANVNYKNTDGKDAMFYAVENKAKRIVPKLIEAGAQVIDISYNDIPIMLHAYDNYKFYVFEDLVKAGADINIKDKNGDSLLIKNVKNEYYSFSKDLIKYEIDVNMQNNDGETALIIAVKKRLDRFVSILSDNGADIFIKDKTGNDADFYSKTGENISEKIIDLMQNFGVKSDPYWKAYTLMIDCPECGTNNVVNGPLERLKCNSCMSEIYFNDNFWDDFRDSGSDSGSDSGPMILAATYNMQLDSETTKKPTCFNCDHELNISNLNDEVEIKCSACGKTSYLYKSPDWLSKYEFRSMFPQYVVSSLPKGNSDDDKQEGKEPVAVKCISCSAAMSVNVETPRNTKCEHCGTVQYLPNPLWLSLHPVKKRKKWFVRFA